MEVAARERSSSGDTTPEKSVVYGHMKILRKFGRAERAENFRGKIFKNPLTNGKRCGKINKLSARQRREPNGSAE